MKKGTKVLTVSILSLLAIFLVINLVNAADSTSVGDAIKSQLSQWFGNAANVSNDLIAQVLLIILLTLIIYSITDFIPFFPADKPGIKWASAIIISVLGLAFLPLAEIKGILISYQALGVVLTSFLPFFIMLTFTIKWETKYPQYSFITSILWFAFFIYLIFRWFQLPTDAAITWAYPITAGVSLIVLFLKGWITRMLIRSLLKGDVEKYKSLNKTELTARAMKLYDEAAQLATVDPVKAQDLQQEANNLERWAFAMH